MPRTTLIALLVLVGLSGADASPEEERPRVSFALSLRTAGTDGRLNLLGPSGEMTYQHDDPLPSEWFTWEFYAMDLERCRTGLNAPVANEPGAGELDAIAQWFVRFRLLERTPQGAVVETELRRVLSAGKDAGIVERHRTLSLIAGEPTLLDGWFADEQRGRCSLFLVEGQAKFVDSSATADTHMAYDVWLIHTGTEGRRSQHLMTSARQGGKVDYAFAPMRFRADGTTDDSGPVRLSVSGSLTGRARPDGGIDVSLEMLHGFGDEKRGSSSGGRKFLQLASGETVEIEVPSLAWSEGLNDLQSAFAAHQTALRITARRAF